MVILCIFVVWRFVYYFGQILDKLVFYSRIKLFKMKIPIKSFYFDRFPYLFWPRISHEKELFLNVPPAGKHGDAD